MKKLDIRDFNNMKLINEFENRILELIDNQDEFTRGDLQGIVSVLVIKILNTGIGLAHQ